MEDVAYLAKGAFPKEYRLAIVVGVGDVLVLDHAGQNLGQEGRLAGQRLPHHPPCRLSLCRLHLQIYYCLRVGPFCRNEDG